MSDKAILRRIVTALPSLAIRQPQRNWEPRFRLPIWLRVLATVAILCAAQFAEGCVYWSATTGDWSDPANWGGTKPTSSIDVAIYNGGIARITQPGATCAYLTLGNSGVGNSGAVNMSDGSLSASQEYIGGYGTGTFTQTGGTNFVAGDFYLGYGAGSNGTYNLNGGTLAVKSISKGSGAAAFNFGGGTLKANAPFSTTVPMNLPGTANVDTAGYAVVFSGGLSGSGGLNKLGSNTLTLSGVNSYSNGTTVNSGNLVFSSTSAIPSTGNIIINSSGALNVAGAYTTVAGWLGSNKINSGSTGTLALTANNSETFDMGSYANLSLGATGNYTFNGAMTPAGNTYRFGGGGGVITVSSNLSGERSLVANGSVSLTGANDYTGNTDINQGVLSISSTAALPGWNTAGRYTVASGAVLAVGDGIMSDDAVSMLGTGNFHSGSAVAFNTRTFDGSALPSTVGLTKIGTGTLTLSKALANTTGAITVASGIFDLGGFSQEASGNVTLQNGTMRNGTLRKNGGNFDFQAGAVSANLADGVSTAGLLKSGTGTLILSGNNTFSNGVALNQGQLTVASDSALGTGTLTIGGDGSCVISGPDWHPGWSGVTTSINNPMVWKANFTYGSMYSLSLNTSGPVTLDSDVTIHCSNNMLTVGGNISGNHSITKTGGDRLTLSGINTFSGGLWLEQGDLIINNGQAIGTGPFTIGGPNFRTLTNSSGSGITFSNNNPISFLSGVSINEHGGNDINFGNGPVTLSASYVGFEIYARSCITIGGQISGAGQLILSDDNGSGSTLILSGDNTYGGGTVIESDPTGFIHTLKVANKTGSATGTGSVTVKARGKLCGSGSIAGPVTVAGVLAPGDSPGVLTVNNQVTFQTGSTFDIEIMGLVAGSGYDQLLTTGPVSLAGSLTASFGSFTPTGHDMLFVLNNTGTGTTAGMFQYADNAKIGTFNGYDWYITYDANNAAMPSLNGGNDVAIYSVPEPSCIILFSIGAASLLAWCWRRRKRTA